MSLPDLQEPLQLLEQKSFDTAVEVLEEKVSALPAHLGAHVLLAYAYEAQEAWDRALTSWEEVHVLMPNSPLADAGKRRVLRRMEGLTGDAEQEAGVPTPHGPNETDSSPPPPSDSTSEEPTDDTPPPEDAAPSDAEEADASSASDEVPSELAELRKQAEREARQGGARSGLADEPPSIPSSPPSEEGPTPTPEEHVEAFEEEEDEDDALDRLIDKLESARIEPDPDAEADAPPAEPEAPSSEEETEEVVSETLARIHEAQEDYETAANIYDQLADQEPDRAEEFQAKAAELRAKTEHTEEEK